MPRPSNADIFDRDPEIEEGTDTAVGAVKAKYPEGKILEAEVNDDASGFEVTVGWMDGETAHIMDVKVDTAGQILSEEERPDVPPGQEKKPLTHRKPHKKMKAK